MQPYDPSTIAKALENLRGWEFFDDSIAKDFVFSDFQTAFDFMVQVAQLAETQQHHPDWRNVYNRVEIQLTTHDAGGVTDKDLKLARAIDEVTGRFIAS